ncbi:hypothetical protein JMJ35_002740 [Cladonia borealis]|uniref:Carrier domain-containing protein n=1 Tax=Cladonia borealis TaxID=184061 RepID=A0AA39R8E1_9LECA|nr:hypothetical protein JMJ35_002740 [Cladonia borealis]
MASVLGPQLFFHDFDSVSHPENLLDSLLPNQNPQVLHLRELIGDGSEVECEYPATPMQEEISRSGYPQWCQLLISLPKSHYATIDRINTTWHLLSARHACLRTRLYTRSHDGKLYHRVLKRISGVRQVSNKTDTQFSTAAGEPDDITASCLVSKSSEDIPIVTLNIRRALVDSVSMGALKTDFALAYLGFPMRDATSMTAYISHIQTDPTVDSALEFWRTAFNGAAVTRITARSPLPGSKNHNNISVKLESEILHQLLDLENNRICSRKCFFESLWALLLSKHTGVQDVVFASTERDRSFSGYANCIGNLDQTYPVRVRLEDNQSFADLAGSMESFHNEASPYGFLGHECILKASNMPCSESLFRYSNTMASPSTAGILTSFPLIMFVNDYEPVKLTLFHTNIIDVGDAELILTHFTNAIRDALSKILIPDLTIDDVDLSSDMERNSIIKAASVLATPEKTRVSHIVTLFEEQVRSTPTAPAIQYEQDTPITFEELNQLANNLARVLHIRRRTFVPVCMDRSVNFIACLLAILKCGAAYVVLDPNGAKQRNEHIVEDCEAEIVLTDSQYASKFKQACVVKDLEGLSGEENCTFESPRFERSLNPEDPCYLIYTSGSTGKPKGVVLSHRAATCGMSHFSLNGRQRWLLFYNPIFSAAQRTMIATLVKGGCLLLASRENLTTSLGKTINVMRADATGLTPSALSLLSPTEVPTLRQISLVGEQANQTLLNTWCEQVELRNTFGLSECTQLNFGIRLQADSNPRVVGRPSDTTSAYILKFGSTELAPLEVAGELCLSGPQLGDGYLKMPEQTAKAFIQNPFGSSKLYRTGDMARQHRDGAIEILGRLDFQVKINGQRTEPNEINEVMLKHSGVKACATVSSFMAQKTCLVAAIVPMKSESFSDLVAELRFHAEKLLPSYMMPSYWLPVDHLPKNPNGKIDIPAIKSQVEQMGPKRLLELSQSEVVDDRPFTDEVEIAVRDVWATVLQLGVESIHHHDSFVALGGSSLQAISAVADLRKRGIAIELAAIVGSSNLAEIATLCASTAVDTSEDPEPFSMINEVTARDLYENHEGVSDAYPATPLQESLIAASLGGNPAYVYKHVWDMKGIDISRLHNAVQVVFEKSDILRTTFVAHGKGYLQVVRHDLKLPWRTCLTELEYYEESAEEQGIALGQPLFKLVLVQERYLIVTIHHSLFDFWSNHFFYQDVAAVFFGESLEDRPPFKRFIKSLLDADPSSAEAFWKECLGDANRTILNHAPGDKQVTVARVIASDFRESAKALGVTSSSIVYAAWAIVLWRQTGDQDVSFATTLSGREMPVSAIHRLDGPTLTTVPQRIIIDPNTTALAFTKRVHTGLFNLMKYAQHGMRRALSAANKSSNFFDTLVNVLVKDQDNGLSQELFKRHGPKPTWKSEYTTLEAEEIESGYQLRLSTTMEPRRAAFLLDSVALTVEAILKTPTIEVGLIDNLGDSERTFLATKDSIEAMDPSGSLLHSQFEVIAATHGNKLAIDWDCVRSITYRELNDYADKIASHLNVLGIGRGDVVPLYLDKSIETIVAILGTMKSGAAYVPLSPENPIERNLYIIKDVSGQLILTQRHFQTVWQDHVRVVNVADVMLFEDTRPKAPVEQSPNDIAYVIYTSGSTGNPKGVKVPHRAASVAVRSMLEAEGRWTGEWRSLQFANYVFDASVQDIFNTLSSGGTLCMAPTEKLLSDLEGTINNMNVKQAIITPTVAKLIEPGRVPGLETLIVGGEPLTSDVVEKWATSRRLLNVYGPTETSMVVTTKQVGPDTSTYNIGKPFPTVLAFIMNQDCTDFVPYGAIGELCVAGPQLSDGYVNNVPATKASFAAIEWLGVEKMYKTGDLARWSRDGDIECLGRKDNQVKIHGHRIELGEVEQAITRTGIVHHAAVIACETNHKLQLVALVVVNPTDSTAFEAPDTHHDEIKKLKESLNSLPPYMVPKIVVSIGKLPLLPSRKVDRKILKKWVEGLTIADLIKYSFESTAAISDYVPVSTEEEGVLERIWSEVLEQDQKNIGALANFFSLGGDSVSAINLVGSCRAAGYSLSVGHVLRFPVLHEMATNLRKVGIKTNHSNTNEYIPPEPLVERIKDQAIDYTFPAPPGQIEFLNQGQRAEQFWMLMTVRRFAASTVIENWLDAVKELTRVNDILRTFYVKLENRDEWIGVVLKRPDVEVSYYHCMDEKHRSNIIEKIWNERFFFGKPWVRYAILNLPDGNKDVVIKMDHALYDGTLLRIFDAQFAAIQRKAPLPAHEEFRDFAMHIWRRSTIESMEFWTKLMVNKQFVFPAAEQPKITAMITKPISISLEDFTTRCGVTPSVVFQTALQLWLMRTTGLRDVAFDYLLSGRNVELPNPQLINGNLANILPFRSRLSHNGYKNQSLKEYLGETQKQFWEITENGNVNIQAIYDAVKIDRNEYGNRTLFLFQPFEPTASGSKEDKMQWVVMKGSQVRMYQPYALVVEISKSLHGHLIKVMYDENCYMKAEAENIATEQVKIVERMIELGSDISIQAFLNKF